MGEVDRLEHCLVVAQSGRMLAQMLRGQDILPVVIDHFADLDTQSYAERVCSVSSLAGAEFEAALDEIAEAGVGFAVYGSGLEAVPASLLAMEQRFVVLGCASSVFERLLDKAEFFGLLREVGIRHPEMRFTAPTAGDDWLVKPCRGHGGVEIAPWRGQSLNHSCYWQRRLSGSCYSVLAVANGTDCVVLGFNQQWTLADRYLFAGIANQALLPEPICEQVSAWLPKLMGVYRLRGLFSVDFMVSDQQAWLLEVNPRIPASAQLYPYAMAMHLAACLREELPDTALPSEPLLYAVLYAQKPLLVSDEIDWPQEVVDRPCAGQQIGQGEPICSIISPFSLGQEPRQVAEQRLNSLDRLLQTGC